MGRRRKGDALQEKVDKYLEAYELDDMNQANDIAALNNMCQLEINIEQIQDALGKIKNPGEDTKKIKELHSALRDATQNWVILQTELAINRRKRKSEEDETPLKYIERLQAQAKKIIDSRFKKLSCSGCGQVLAKYMIYVADKGEHGSIESGKTPIEAYKHTVRVECWKCGKMAEISNEELVILEK